MLALSAGLRITLIDGFCGVGVWIADSWGSAPDHEGDLDQEVLDRLEHQPAMTRHALRDELAVQNQRLGRTLVRLEEQGQIQRGHDGWRLSDPRTVPRSPP